MTFEIRAARADEMDQFGLVGGYVYGGAFGDGPDNLVARGNRPEWTLCAFADGRMAATYSCIPFTMRANGKAVALAGVTAVGTLPEYRRQGLLRTITRQSLLAMRERGQAVAALWASQAAIYQRYGYALAAAQLSYRVDSVDIGFFDGNGGTARVARISAEQAYDVVKGVYIDFIAQRTCYVHRAKALWLNNALATNEATGPAHIAVARDNSGAASGYVIYTVRSGRVDHPTRPQELVIKDFAWLNVDAYRSLWSWLARHDVVGCVLWARAPIDDPAAELFVEPRLLNARQLDGIWLRVVDAPVALAARGYAATDAITLHISGDELAPWNNGTYRLECSPDGAHVSPAHGEPELRMSVKALASLYTGLRTPRQLAHWGLLAGSDAAIERAARVFATHHAPHCPDSF